LIRGRVIDNLVTSPTLRHRGIVFFKDEQVGILGGHLAIPVDNIATGFDLEAYRRRQIAPVWVTTAYGLAVHLRNDMLCAQ